MGAARLLLLLVLLALGVVGASLRGPEALGQPAGAEPVGRELFLESCASCHGVGAAGTAQGPSLLEAGTAAVDFQLRTGRMPLADPRNQAVRKPPAFDAGQVAAIVSYLGTFIEGPAIPEVSLIGRDLSNGQALFVDNCAACHGATGNGGAVGGEAIAPSLFRTEPIEAAEAIVTGPGQMPRFGFDASQLSDIVAFVRFLQEEESPGGADIGGIGPVPEGFVAWFVGISALVAIAVLLTIKRRGPRPSEGEAPR